MKLDDPGPARVRTFVDYAQVEPEGPLTRVPPGLIRIGDELMLKTPYKNGRGGFEVLDCSTGRQHAYSTLPAARQELISVVPLRRIRHG